MLQFREWGNAAANAVLSYDYDDRRDAEHVLNQGIDWIESEADSADRKTIYRKVRELQVLFDGGEHRRKRLRRMQVGCIMEYNS